MRKDVKLAFVVGGILISVLVVYVLLVPAKPENKPVVLETGPAKPDQASTPDKITGPAKPTGAKVADEKIAISPSTKPTDPFASKDSDKDKEDRWMLALSRGTVPMLSAPLPPAPHTQA